LGRALSVVMSCEDPYFVRTVRRKILDRDKVRTMHAGGQSVREIAAKVGVSKSLIANILKR
jgi:transposase